MSLFLARKPYISDSGGKLRNHCIGCWLLLQSKLSITGLRRYRVVFVGGSRGTSPFPLTGSGGMERGVEGKGERDGWGRPPALLPPLASASNTTLRRYTIKVKVKGKVIACTPAHPHVHPQCEVSESEEKQWMELNWTNQTKDYAYVNIGIHVRTEDINATPSAIRWISSDPCSKSGCMHQHTKSVLQTVYDKCNVLDKQRM